MKIIEKEIIAEAENTRIIRLKIVAPQIALKSRAGQFVVVMVSEEGERIPLTIVDKDREAIILVFQEVGLTTTLLGKLNVGDYLYVLVGPLGNPTELSSYGKVILVGGGVGIAEIYPVAKALRAAKNQIITILGARTKALLILEEELKGVSDELYIATDDGSYGEKGFTTDVLERLLLKQRYDLVYAVGPIAMMRKVAQVTQKFKIRTLVSLNALMVDATGMCGCCRVTVLDETKFSCIDGPEFDAHLVNWDELEKRNKIYADKEKHLCHLYNLP